MARKLPLSFLILLGLACGRGPKDEDAVQIVYRDYRVAVKEASAERIKGFVTAERQKELSGADAGVKLQLIGQLMPAEARILKTTVTGAQAVLEVEGETAGQRMTGTVRMVKEGGAWKVDKESWSMKVDLTGAAGGLPLAGAPAPFFSDPQGPPQAQAVLEGHQGEVSRLAYTPDGRYLISASYGDFSIRAWRADTGREASMVKTEQRVRDLAIAPYGKAIYTADAYKNVRVWPLENGKIGRAHV